MPFDVDVAPGTLCAACDADPPHYDRARAALAYDDHSKSLLLRFKHGDRTDLAPLMSLWMARAASSLIPDADIIVPVPLHRTRLLSRRFNQAALLAQTVSRVGGVGLVPGLIHRIRKTPSQGHLSKLARRRNVRGAFRLSDKYRRWIAGKRILLVDDVFTTGATVDECARVLKRAGTGPVDVVTIARVVKPRD